MPPMKPFVVDTLLELESLAANLGEDLVGLAADNAVVLALHGNLGAGKTTFVQYLAKYLGVSETVTSPTFVIMKRYQSDKNHLELIHIDAYRIEAIDEMRVLGFESLLTKKHTIICIEWAERIAALLPPDTIHLKFELNDEIRTITKN